MPEVGVHSVLRAVVLGTLWRLCGPMSSNVVVLVVVSVVRRLVCDCVDEIMRLGSTSDSKNTSHFTICPCVGVHHCRSEGMLLKRYHGCLARQDE